MLLKSGFIFSWLICNGHGQYVNSHSIGLAANSIRNLESWKLECDEHHVETLPNTGRTFNNSRDNANWDVLPTSDAFRPQQWKAKAPTMTLSYRAKVAISIYGVIASLIIIGTVYDLILSSWGSSRKNKGRTESQITPSVRVVSSDEAEACSSTDDQETMLRAEQSKWLFWKNMHPKRVIGCVMSIRRWILSSQPKEFLRRFILCFSLYTNGSKFLNTSQKTGTLRAVNGIRFFSLSWVIVGHTLQNFMSFSDNESLMIQWVFTRWTYQAMENAPPSVDSFFTLSGLLVTYLTMKELKKVHGKLNWFMFYLHRYLRLTAPLGLMMLFVIPLFEYFGNGPLWDDSRDYCHDKWWETILYVWNFDHEEDAECIGVTWYITTDMQFYVLSPIILIPLYFRPRLGMVILGIFLLGTTVSAGVISRVNLLAAQPYEDSVGDYKFLYYIKPYTRMGPYLIGMASGYFLHRTDCTLKLKWYFNLLLWSVAISVGLAVVYGLVESDQHKIRLTWDVAALYNALHRMAWGSAVSWVVISCATGNGGFVNTLLSWEPFIIFSRCSFMAYLIHDYTIEWYFSNEHTKDHLSEIAAVYRCLGSVSLAFLVACVALLIMEAPVLNLETLLFRRERRK